MVRRNEEILYQLLEVDPENLAEFINNLKPETREYLDVLLEKADKNLDKLVHYIESQK